MRNESLAQQLTKVIKEKARKRAAYQNKKILMLFKVAVYDADVGAIKLWIAELCLTSKRRCTMIEHKMETGSGRMMNGRLLMMVGVGIRMSMNKMCRPWSLVPQAIGIGRRMW